MVAITLKTDHHIFFWFLWPRGVRNRISLSKPPPTWKQHQAAKTRRTQPSAAPTGAARSPATKACKRPAAARSAQLRGRPALLAAVDDVALMGALEVVLTLMAARAPALELAHATAKHQPTADVQTAVPPLANPTSAFSHHRVLRSRRRSSWRLRHQGVLQSNSCTPSWPQHRTHCSWHTDCSSSRIRQQSISHREAQHEPGKAARRDSRPTCDRSRG